MDPHAPKMPPRYVPTLTEVVTPPDTSKVESALPATGTPAPEAVHSPRLPEVPPTPREHVSLRSATLQSGVASWRAVPATPEALEEHLLERLRTTLQQRLDAAIEQSVQEQTQAFALRLRHTLTALAQQILHETLQDVQPTAPRAQRALNR